MKDSIASIERKVLESRWLSTFFRLFTMAGALDGPAAIA